MYPRAFIPPQRARRMAGWLDCENLQEGPRAKDVVVTSSSFFSPADNSNWAVACGEGAYICRAHTKRLKLAGAVI